MDGKDAGIRSRDELLHELEAAQLRLAFYDMREREAALIEAGAGEELKELIDAVQPEMLRTIDREVRRMHWRRFAGKALPGVKHAAQIAAGILLILYIGFSTALAVSPAVRSKAMELLIRMTDEYARITLEESADGEFFVPADWQGEYYPAYIPEDFVFEECGGVEECAYSGYVNQDGDLIDFSENTSDTVLHVNTEDAEIIYTTVHDQPAMASIKDGNVVMVWAEFNKYFCIVFHGDLDTTLQIARSVVRIK